jgi:uncharacterized protein (TIGR03118 family)
MLPCALAAGAALAASSFPAAAVDVSVTNLVTDNQAAHAAQITDPGLVNAWGMSFGPTSPFWVSANGTGTANLYSVNPTTQVTTKVPLTVSVPTANVTGQAFNPLATAFNGNRFLFVGEDGTFSGWRPALGTAAEPLASLSAVYKGTTFGNVGGNGYAYAADFHGGVIQVFKGTASAPNLTGNFTDPNLPSGYTPFNVQDLGGKVYVSYAVPDSARHDEVPGAGLGVVDAFDQQGKFLNRVATGGTLNAPWGMAIAPSSFGALAGALLVGNFGDGRISAYNLGTNSFLGQLMGAGGTPLTIDGLWALSPGNGSGGGSTSRIYFTAGPDGESHGLFGVLTPTIPEPGSYLLMLIGLMLVGVMRRGQAR